MSARLPVTLCPACRGSQRCDTGGPCAFCRGVGVLAAVVLPHNESNSESILTPYLAEQGCGCVFRGESCNGFGLVEARVYVARTCWECRKAKTAERKAA